MATGEGVGMRRKVYKKGGRKDDEKKDRQFKLVKLAR
jgi:hypothetical protein